MFHSSLILFCKQIKMMQNWYVKFVHLRAKRTYLPHLVDAKGRNYAVLAQKGRIYAVTSLLH